MKIDNFLQSKLFQGIILGIAGLIILVLVFKFGIFIGVRKADFSFKWAGAYHRNFAGPKEGFLVGFVSSGKDPSNTNGAFGQIIKIDNESIIVKDKNNVEKNILVIDNTALVFQRKNIKLSDLKLGDYVVVIGESNNEGQIEAGLIRVMPSPPTSFYMIYKRPI